MKVKTNRTRKRKNSSLAKIDYRVVYTGSNTTATSIKLTQYDKDFITERDVSDQSDFYTLTQNNLVNWIQVTGLSNAEKITSIAKQFGLSILDAKDILNPQHVVQIEKYEDSVFLILNFCYYDEFNELKEEHICLFLKGNTVISFAENQGILFDYSRKAIEDNVFKIRTKTADALLYILFSNCIHQLTETALFLEESLEDLEEALLDISSEDNIGISIQSRRKQYMKIKKIAYPLRDQFAKLLHESDNIIRKVNLPLFNDIYDQLLFVSQTAESCREIISSLVDLYISNNDLRLNDIMKRLTVVSTIFIPLTFMAGVWGMNFEFMPELKWKYGYLICWSLMLLVAVFVWWYIRRRKWY